MAANKLKDIAVVTGSYERDGETKKRYKTVGAVWESDKGGKFITLDRSFNPAGVPFREGADSIVLSIFDPREREGGRGGTRAESTQSRRPAKQAEAVGGAASEKDDIPF